MSRPSQDWPRADLLPELSPLHLGQRPNDLRRANRARVLRLVRRYGPVSRAEIAERSGLSRAALTAIAQDLLDEGVLAEGARVGPGASPRRPGVGLTFDPSYATAVGVELSDGRLRGVLLDLAGGVLAAAERPLHGEPGEGTVGEPEAARVVGEIAETVRELCLDAPSAPRGVGLAVSGQVDPVGGISVSIPGLPRWRDVPLRAEVERRTGLPASLDWRVNAATLAEQWYGVAREADDFVFVNVSDGVGMGLVLGGEIRRGWRSLAGGLGHIQVGVPPARARRCVCGNQGCLQTLVSVPAVMRQVSEALAAGVHSALDDPALGNDGTAGGLTLDGVVRAARAGDKLALGVLEDAGEYVGRAVATVVNLLNPPLVVVGGEITRAQDVVHPQVLRAARRWSRPRALDGVRVVTSGLQPGGAVVGAATMVLSQVLEDKQGRAGSDAGK